MSDQERDKLSKDEDGTDDVEAHQLSERGKLSMDDDDSDDVEAHKLGGKDS